MKNKSISELEELVLLATGAIFPEAYAYGIKKELKEQASRSLSLATIHTILYRLEERGLLKSELGGQTQKRGGRSKRLFVLTTTGLNALQEINEVRSKLWGRINPLPL